MGYYKWMLTHGFGSPGQTARVITKGFHYYLASNPKFDDSVYDDAYKTIFRKRAAVQEKLRNKGCLLNQFQSEIDEIVNIGDMPLFVFVMQSLESKQFRVGVTNENVDLILEIIREETAKLDDSLIKLDKIEYKKFAIGFINLIYSR